MARKTLTADDIKARFRERGQTITSWAKEHGFPRNSVYRVLNGVDKGHYGQSHDIAVALGLKPSSDRAAA